MPKILTHIDEHGRATMVDVSPKEVTHRRAIATARITMKRETLDVIQTGASKKGDVLAVARVAGISAAKETSRLIPLCHNIPLDRVSVEFALASEGDLGYVDIEVEACATARTGVEMEALTACSIAALTLYDMGKAIDRGMCIERVRLERKEGGASGPWERS